MKAISLYQPWATAMACGAKTVETRSWPTKHVGLLAIHAGKRVVDVSDIAWIGEFARDAEPIPRGAIVAVVEMFDCIRPEGFMVEVSKEERVWGDFRPGRWCWLTRNFRRLKQPVPCRGFQGIWNLPSDVAAKVVEALP